MHFYLRLLSLQEFDREYGPGWQCIVGMDFGSFVTHCYGCFIYFCIGSLMIMLFRGTALGAETDVAPFTIGTVKA